MLERASEGCWKRRCCSGRGGNKGYKKLELPFDFSLLAPQCGIFASRVSPTTRINCCTRSPPATLLKNNINVAAKVYLCIAHIPPQNASRGRPPPRCIPEKMCGGGASETAKPSNGRSRKLDKSETVGTPPFLYKTPIWGKKPKTLSFKKKTLLERGEGDIQTKAWSLISTERVKERPWYTLGTGNLPRLEGHPACFQKLESRREANEINKLINRVVTCLGHRAQKPAAA